MKTPEQIYRRYSILIFVMSLITLFIVTVHLIAAWQTKFKLNELEKRIELLEKP